MSSSFQSLEQDIAEDESPQPHSPRWKGKAREQSDVSSPAASSDDIAYPPVNEDTEDTRRVEEVSFLSHPRRSSLNPCAEP